MSAAPVKCPRCGIALPPSAPEGLCPRCLGALNFATETVRPGAEKLAAQPPLTPEQLAVHFPQLEIIECLGRGGMGVVYKARQKSLNRMVALKLLAPERVQDAKFAERFTQEAQALAKLNHPSIVTIHDFGEAGGFYFLLMEFVDGVNLRQLLRSRKLSPEEALAIVPPLCDALQYAHERGIVHRDIKPENLLLDKEGRVKVADFGIAKMLASTVGRDSVEPPSADEGGASGASISGAGQDARSARAGSASRQGSTESHPTGAAVSVASTAGTPGYMAPEQSSAPQKVDARADIYSLGVVFYEMLTGELPGAKLQPPSRKVQIDVRLDEIVLRALEVKPELRYQTAGEFRTQLETFAHAKPETPNPKPFPQLLKISTATLTTPELLATARGQFFAYRTRGQLILDAQRLTHARAGVTTVIPLAAIRDVSVGEYPSSMNPVGIDVLSIGYEENGVTRRVLLSPMEGWFAWPGTWNARVAEWREAIAHAAHAATGRAQASLPREQLPKIRNRPWLMVPLLVPLLGLVPMLLFIRARGGAGFPTDAMFFLPLLFGGLAFLVPMLLGRRRRTAVIVALLVLLGVAALFVVRSVRSRPAPGAPAAVAKPVALARNAAGPPVPAPLPAAPPPRAGAEAGAPTGAVTPVPPRAAAGFSWLALLLAGVVLLLLGGVLLFVLLHKRSWTTRLLVVLAAVAVLLLLFTAAAVLFYMQLQL